MFGNISKLSWTLYPKAANKCYGVICNNTVKQCGEYFTGRLQQF